MFVATGCDYVSRDRATGGRDGTVPSRSWEKLCTLGPSEHSYSIDEIVAVAFRLPNPVDEASDHPPEHFVMCIQVEPSRAIHLVRDRD